MCKYSFTSKRLMAKKKIATTCVSMIKRVASTARKKSVEGQRGTDGSDICEGVRRCKNHRWYFFSDLQKVLKDCEVGDRNSQQKEKGDKAQTFARTQCFYNRLASLTSGSMDPPAPVDAAKKKGAENPNKVQQPNKKKGLGKKA